VLLVDDEPTYLRALERVLQAAGYAVVAAADGGDAVRLLRDGTVDLDLVISDIMMPGTDGVDLLRYSRTVQPDLPVVLVTGSPSIETAIKALDYGAYKYLLKPVSPDELLKVTQKAVQMAQMARLRREAVSISRQGTADRGLRAAFGEALADLWMAFQPILRSDGELFGHEALMRVKHPRIQHPGEMLDVAEQLGTLEELGRKVRSLSASPVQDSPASGALFVNLHPRDLDDAELMARDTPLAGIADRVVLEITERSSVGDVQNLRRKIIELREVGYRIAVDDLGAGYAGLTSFALLEPDIVKIDMTLVRDIDKSPVKQRLIRSLTTLCGDMGISVVGEGVETREEKDALVELGCDLFQGYLFAKPSRPFPAFGW
jgi:EAL domain-containing protein (putative c-di-GMP-specific phosphodiesterase class I)